MSTVRIIGDVHGKFGPYRNLIRNVPSSIQVGDMGVGFIRRNGTYDINPPYDAMSKGRHLFIRGNHDNPEVCRKQKYWIADGSLVDGIFCLGGATSIDRQWRTEGYDWWADEECSYTELQQHIDTYAALRPEVVITHEAPASVAEEILAAFNKTKIHDPSRTRMALQAMLEIHQPKHWFFGHWHESMSFVRGRTNFRCLAELEFVDFDH